MGFDLTCAECGGHWIGAGPPCPFCRIKTLEAELSRLKEALRLSEESNQLALETTYKLADQVKRYAAVYQAFRECVLRVISPLGNPGS